MIAYEDLEKALGRWKARRPDATAANAATSSAGLAEASEATPMRDDLEATSMGEEPIPSGISQEEGPASDSTGELEIGDAIPEERD